MKNGHPQQTHKLFVGYKQQPMATAVKNQLLILILLRNGGKQAAMYIYTYYLDGVFGTTSLGSEAYAHLLSMALGFLGNRFVQLIN